MSYASRRRQTICFLAMFFGVYLVEQDLVTREQVLEALYLQHARRPPLGQIALRERKMTVAQVFDTLNNQTDFDLRFGETAIRLGYLKLHELMQLMDLQRAEVMPIGEILVETGALDRVTMESALSRFLGQFKSQPDPRPQTFH